MKFPVLWFLFPLALLIASAPPASISREGLTLGCDTPSRSATLQVKHDARESTTVRVTNGNEICTASCGGTCHEPGEKRGGMVKANLTATGARFGRNPGARAAPLSKQASSPNIRVDYFAEDFYCSCVSESDCSFCWVQADQPDTKCYQDMWGDCEGLCEETETPVECTQILQPQEKVEVEVRLTYCTCCTV